MKKLLHLKIIRKIFNQRKNKLKETQMFFIKKFKICNYIVNNSFLNQHQRKKISSLALKIQSFCEPSLFDLQIRHSEMIFSS